jgi:hypothetical protein
VYYEVFGDIRAAIVREKQIKSWSREKRMGLIEAKNPTWTNLAESRFRGPQKQIPRSPTADLGMTAEYKAELVFLIGKFAA